MKINFQLTLPEKKIDLDSGLLAGGHFIPADMTIPGLKIIQLSIIVNESACSHLINCTVPRASVQTPSIV